MDNVSFGGVSSSTYGIYAFRKDNLSVPARQVEKVTVPGRNGDIIIDKGRYENVPISYGCIAVGSNASQRFRNYVTALSVLTGYHGLWDTFSTDERYVARLSGRITPDYTRSVDGIRFTLTFDRKPQRFLRSGDIPIHAIVGGSPQEAVQNNQSTVSIPSIYVEKGSSSTPTIYVNNTRIKIDFSTIDNIDIDCDTQKCITYTSPTEPGEPADDKIELLDGEFPFLSPGENEILGDVDAIDIYGRWWRL